jgi:hypothetical protein
VLVVVMVVAAAMQHTEPHTPSSLCLWLRHPTLLLLLLWWHPVSSPA